ncbi:hypothetical protein [Ekhidna sp.]|uniref:hypothetical protein n=1 Tax=Ekhidna sp. TaxID=2608089 RepID=UPI003CCBCF05
MKPNLTTYLLAALLLLCGYHVQSQNSDSTTSQTIVKLENPYKKGKTKWLNNNGFDTKSYDWDNPDINLYLDQSLKSRSTGNVLIFTGGTLIAAGLVINVLASFAHSIGDSKPGEPYQVFTEPYYLGGALVVSSIPFLIKSDKKLKQAIKIKDLK